MSNIDKPAIDFSKPLETESGEPVKHICHDVIEYKCARVCVDIATGVVYSSPYVGLKIRNKEASPRAKLREQIESAADAYRQFDNGWISEMKCGELSHEYLLFVKEPKNVLALLGELATKEEQRANWFQMAQKLGEDLDAAEKRNAELESDKSRMMDALHAAVALNSAGINLNDFDECVLRLHEWSALPDYCIALYVDFIHGLVSENKLLDFGYVNDNGAFAVRQAEKRLAELERSETQLIDERDNAEAALNDAYKAVMGQAPEWSNWFSFADAIDEIELVCRLWRNQAEDIIQFRARIAELEARTVNLSKCSVGEVMHMSGFSRDYAEGWCSGNDNAIHEIRAAGIGKGE